RTLIALDAETVRGFLARSAGRPIDDRVLLDARSLFALCRPDAPDLELSTLCALELGRAARADALGRALDLAELLAAVARGAQAGGARCAEVATGAATRLPRSPWRALLEPASVRVGAAGEAATGGMVGEGRESGYLAIGASDEEPVPFEME